MIQSDPVMSASSGGTAVLLSSQTLGPNDVAPAVRRILRPWDPLDLPDLPPTGAGLEEASRLTLLLAVRDQMFIKALEVVGVSPQADGVAAFGDAHEVLLGNLSLLRSGHVGQLEVPEVLDSVRDAGEGLRTIRRQVINGLPELQRLAVMDAEWHVRVSTEEIRDQIDRAENLIDDIADGLLDSDWFNTDALE